MVTFFPGLSASPKLPVTQPRKYTQAPQFGMWQFPQDSFASTQSGEASYYDSNLDNGLGFGSFMDDMLLDGTLFNMFPPLEDETPFSPMSEGTHYYLSPDMSPSRTPHFDCMDLDSPPPLSPQVPPAALAPVTRREETGAKARENKLNATLLQQYILPYCRQFPSGPGQPYAHAEIARRLMDDPAVKALLPEGKAITARDLADVYKFFAKEVGHDPTQPRMHQSGDRNKISKTLRDTILVPYCTKFPSGPGNPYSHAAIARALDSMPLVRQMLPQGAKITDADVASIQIRELKGVNRKSTNLAGQTRKAGDPKISKTLRERLIIPFCKANPSGPGKDLSHADVARMLTVNPEVRKMLPTDAKITEKDINYIYRAYLTSEERKAPPADFAQREHKKGDLKISDALRDTLIIPYCRENLEGNSYAKLAKVLMDMPEVVALLPQGAKINRDDVGRICKKHIEETGNQPTSAKGRRTAGGEKIKPELREIIIAHSKNFPSGLGGEYSHPQVAKQLMAMPEVQALLPEGATLTGGDISGIRERYILKTKK